MTPKTYREEAGRELRSILEYWMGYATDEGRGGFIGRVDEQDRPDASAPKGLVLNARILWSFSAAFHASGRWIYRPLAVRAYEYLLTHFWDKEAGGFFWSLTPDGHPVNTRKQIYGQAFALYGLSEYHRATAERHVLDEAIDLYRLIEEHGYDHRHGGYFEAFDRHWSPLEDGRLSEKDANEKKTMNTNLHVLEAYANLYSVWPDDALRERIGQLLDVFTNHIIDRATGHLGLFFTEGWEPGSTIISYGHDIEAGWLLHAAAVTIACPEREKTLAGLLIGIATAVEAGLDMDGGLWYEKRGGNIIPEKHWWSQAEAMVGFLYAWKLNGDNRWWRRSIEAWAFVKRYIRQPDGREWYWGVSSEGVPMPGEDKAGFWKCPYHNTRACLEILNILADGGGSVRQDNH